MANLLPIMAIAAGAFLLMGRGGMSKTNKESDAILTVIGDTGLGVSAFEITDKAYWLAYPECPKKLDPANPEHQTCLESWMRIWADVKARKVAGRTTPGVSDMDTGPDGNLSKEVKAWINSLSAAQKTTVKNVVGEERYAGMVASSNSGDDVRTQAQLDRLAIYVGSLGLGDKISKGRALQNSLSAAQVSKAKTWMGA